MKKQLIEKKNRKIKYALSAMICMLFIATAFSGAIGNTLNNEIVEQSMSWEWVRYPGFVDYCPGGMPDFSQLQDTWKSIWPGPDQVLQTTLDPRWSFDDQYSTDGNYIAPGPNCRLDTPAWTAVGDDTVEWCFCGPTSMADILWLLDSMFDLWFVQGDTCNLVTAIPPETDDHSSANVPLLIKALAQGPGGMTPPISECATEGRTLDGMVKIGLNAWINQHGVGGVEVKNKKGGITGSFLENLIDNRWPAILILDFDDPDQPIGHAVALSGILKTTTLFTQIEISDPGLDKQNPTTDQTLHNDASIVSHDIYNYNQQFVPTMQLTDYPGVPFVDEVVWLEWEPIYQQLPGINDADPDEVIPVELCCFNVDEPTEDTYFVAMLSPGLSYEGNGMLNGEPWEPEIEDNQLKWENFDPWGPNEEWIIEFDLRVSSEPPDEVSLRTQIWSYCPSWNRYAYGEDSITVPVVVNHPPVKPSTPTGTTSGKTGTSYPYTTSTTDPDADKVKYAWDWDGDDMVDQWDDNNGNYYQSGETISTSNSWDSDGTYNVKVMAEDIHGVQSEWSDPLSVSMPKSKVINRPFLNFIQNHPNLFPILRYIFRWIQ